MYQVLYRKWRPKIFADVVGQPQVTVTLKNELVAGRVAHAYLFTGSRGTGKTTCAKILAKAINCLSSEDGDPCGECDNCRGIDDGSILDVVEIDAASNNGVENIRNLREEAAFTPAAAKYRVYIIDEVHMLSIGAFNALLKTLEEPPQHVVFILATTEVHKLPATILSRCQRFDFRRISPEEIAGRIIHVAQEEQAAITEEAALLIAQIADGALRDALSLLDQCLGRSKNIDEEVVSAAAGLAGSAHLFSLSKAILEQDSSAALAEIHGLYQASKDLVRLCEELVGHFRTLMLFHTMKSPRDFVTASQQEYYKLQEHAKQFSLPDILHVLETLQEAAEHMNRGLDQRVEMEMAIIRVCSPSLDVTPAALLRRIDQLERAVRSGIKREVPGKKEALIRPIMPGKPVESEIALTEPVLAETPSSKVPEKPVPKDTEVGGVPQVNDLRLLQEKATRLSCWPEVLQALKGYSNVIASAFHGSVAYESGEYVLIDAPNSMAFELLRKSAQRDKMRIALREVTGKVYKLGPYQRETKPAEKDPLDELAELAESAGIQVTKTALDE
jgi:DNA polymerase-3 subunit gamma/tau